MGEKNDEEMQEIISSLPKENGWLPQPLYKYENFWFYKIHLQNILARQNFHPKPNTVVLSTFPKCGTTWFAALLFAIVNRTRYDYSIHPLLTRNPHDCVPWLEPNVEIQSGDPKVLSNVPIVKTHSPNTLLPDSVNQDHLNCLIVYMCRDPMDVFVSLWHFSNKLRPDGSPPLGLNEAFESYCKGVMPFGSYWDHVMEYWKASITRPNKVMFFRYEDMKRQPTELMKTLARFVGFDFTAEEEHNGVIERIVELCSFDKLTGLEVNRSVERKSGKEENANVNNSVFFRKGEIGDHKNVLTSEMISRLRDVIGSKFKDSSLETEIYAQHY